MISCTEFIPLYSEFFKFMESKGGHEAVVRYWEYISDTSIGDKTNPNSLASHVEARGFEGCWTYWKHTLTEEACDTIRIYDPVNKTIYSQMRHCPSKGMLNDLKHIEPYYDYCGHCSVLYSRVLDKYGITKESLGVNAENASCSGLIYMAGHRPEGEALKRAMTPSEDKIIMDLYSEDNKYLHRDFHLIGDNALRYCGLKYGDNGVREFMDWFANSHYGPIIADIKARGLVAMQEKLEQIYEVEEFPEVLHTELTDDELIVTVDRNPVIDYMHSLNQKPSKYYVEETRGLYAAVADACGLGFEMLYYNEDGGTKYRFFKRAF